MTKKIRSMPDRLVVLTFDDTCKSDAEYVAPLLKTYGFGATFFVNDHHSGRTGWNLDHYLDWPEIRRVHEMGFEIGNHTASHPDVSGLTDQAFTAELEQIERRCSENGIDRPVSFCYPGFHFSAAAVRLLRSRGYKFARRGGFPEIPYDDKGSRGPTYNPALHDPLLIPATGFSGPHWGMDDLKWAVGQAQGGRIAVLCFHGVPDIDHWWVHTDPAAFKSYMDFLAGSGCTVIALRGLADYVDLSKIPDDPNARLERVLQ